MAFAKEIMGVSAMELGSSKLFHLHGNTFNHSKRQFLVSPCVVASEKKKLRKSLTRPVAAISEHILRKSFPIPSSVSLPSHEVQTKPSNFTVRAVLTVRNKMKEDLKETFFKHIDALADKIGRNVALELVSTELDPKTKSPKKSKVGVLKDWSKKGSVKAERVNYTVDFVVESSFGVPGAITVTNKHHKEFFLEAVTVEGFPCGPLHFPCNSWVQFTRDNPGYRIFFSNKPYLPNETPAGLRALREEELTCLRGDGKGVRKLSDRVYDYDVYNDLGNPDKGFEFSRPILGGPERPYPRRCRTGRAPTESDVRCESRVEKPLPTYVPRDEQFEEPKRDAFSFGRLKAVLHNLIPSLKASISSENHEFNGFAVIDSLYSEGLLLQLGVQDELLKKLPASVGAKILANPGILKYDTPKIISKDKFAWLRDDEFARQAIAGINPVSIQRMEVFPPVSKLDPEIYGPQESALKEEHILGQINSMTVQQALAENKLFTVDYHDIYIPFLDKINSMDGRKAYATRTVYFLTAQGTLKPVAIELSLPCGGPSSRPNKRVVTPAVDATTNWMWQLAKAHVGSNDAGVHQLVNHWLRTHACMEPFILSAHRQLSTMHPIYKLLEPHMRYTLEINGVARQTLISADGVIESCFTPGRFCMEISAATYKNSWRFDQEGLPADLIRRGIAVPDPTQPHGIKLLIDDYPYANDGLMIWAAIRDWVDTYVKHYYPTATHVCNDAELQSWYAESVKVGHSDVSNAVWWPTLDCPDDVASIMTTLIWLASAQHAALNFGQYPYGGYVPNRPPMMRRLMPQEGDPEHESFVADPQRYFLSALPSVLQTTKFMAVVDMLSTHSPDEEYLGERGQPDTWTGDAELVEAFYAFSAEVGRIEKEIDRRNADPSLKNRCGAGVLPYELLAPSSEPGVTCRGVPNSVSI